MMLVDAMVADICDMPPDDPDDPQSIIIRVDALQATLEEYVSPLEAQVATLRAALEALDDAVQVRHMSNAATERHPRLAEWRARVDSGLAVNFDDWLIEQARRQARAALAEAPPNS